MNLQEHIRNVLKEETELVPFIKRRVSYRELELEFNESLIMASEMIYRSYIKDRKHITLERLVNATISMMIDGIHYELHSKTSDETQWYGYVYNNLKKHYQNRIELRYEELKNLISNIIE